MGQRTCSVEGCDKKHFARGWCKGHYTRWLKHGELQAHIPLAKKRWCSIKGCEAEVAGHGYCRHHYGRWKYWGDPLGGQKTLEQRFWEKVSKDGPGGCWLWTANLSGGGYGNFHLDGRERVAHRLAYEWLVGPIPEGLDLDHLCRVRRCVNPAHLEPVTRRENVLRSPIAIAAQHARKTHCPAGHEYTPENTYTYNGWRCCRRCRSRQTGSVS